MMANTVKFGDSENCFTRSECANKSDWVLTLNTSRSRFCSTLLVQNYEKFKINVIQFVSVCEVTSCLQQYADTPFSNFR